MPDSLDVLVVGAGPTGLTLAAELFRRGLRVRIVDKSEAPTTLSKAIAVHARTLEILDDLGVAHALDRRGVRLHGATIQAGGQTLAEVDFAGLESRFPHVLSVAQAETEAVLGDLVVQRGGDVERRTELVSFEQDDRRVVATLRSPQGEESLEAAYLVGCDGAHSAVRHALGATFEGHGYDDTFVLADVTMEAGLPADRISTFFADDGIVACFPMAGARWRIIVTAAGSTPAEPTVADVERIVVERSGRPATLSDPQWIAPFRIHCRQVGQYRTGRAFLAGDAAHIHSPAGGQGMNTGIQDAHNLAWKLACAVDASGAAADLLLESYGAERHAIGKALLRSTDVATKLGTLHSAPAIGIRNTVARLLSGLEPVRRKIAHSLAELDIAYPESVLSRDFSTLASHLADASTRPGSFAPALPGLTGDAFTVVVAKGNLDRVRARLSRRDGRARVVVLGVEAGAGPAGGIDDEMLLVVRPDLYIGARATVDQVDDVAGYLDRLLARA